MAYLDTNDRTARPTTNEQQIPLGRIPVLNGVYVGFVKSTYDVQLNGRLRVWIPELGSAPDEEQGWITVNYCSPFAGATNNDTTDRNNVKSFEGTQTSYGMWMIPPDINNQVLVMFINGDAGRGVWIGCLYNQFMNNMVPAVAASENNYQYNGTPVPAAEYNKWDLKTVQPDAATKPYSATKFKGLGNQGLIKDRGRGITTTSARRESPSNVFGILTPGPIITSNEANSTVRRKGGSSLVMDDGVGSEYIQLATKTGAQIRIDETNGFIYLINRDGTAWVEMDQTGNVSIFGASNISMRSQRDINLRADRNINIEAGQNIFMKAAKDTVEETTSFTYDVNNVPVTKNIPVWTYKGEGQGDGGNIVMQSLNNWQNTVKSNAFLTVIDNNLEVKVGNTANITTDNGGQNFNSKSGIKMTTDASFDLSATGNIRVGSKDSVSVVGISGITLCSDNKLSFNSGGNIAMAAGSDIALSAIGVGIDAVLTATGTAFLVAQYALTADNLGGTSPFVAPPADTTVAEAAMSANSARPAEVKPMNSKINILATWSDPESKFKRDSQSVQTTVSTLPTYEPCPEHESFSFANIAGYTPVITPDDKTYIGSGGVGNPNAGNIPAASVDSGSNNTAVPGDPPAASSVTTDININALRCQLKIHEGVKNISYTDAGGVSAGIGHLLRANELIQYPLGSPVSNEQIEVWFTQDISTAIKIGQELLGSTWGNLTDIRKRAVADLAYNLGKAGLSGFRLFLAALKAGNYDRAGAELKNSQWFNQVGRRGPNIITMIVKNIDPNRCDVKFPG